MSRRAKPFMLVSSTSRFVARYFAQFWAISSKKGQIAATSKGAGICRKEYTAIRYTTSYALRLIRLRGGSWSL
jgi:hypothetical protein